MCKLVIVCTWSFFGGDDRLGLVVFKVLKCLRSMPSVKVISAPLASLDLLGAVRGADKVVVIDALKLGLPPGTVCRLNWKALSLLAPERHAHGIGVLEAIFIGYAIYNDMPKRLVLLGIEGERFTGEKLSESVKKALPLLLRLIFEEVLDALLDPPTG